VFFGTGSDLTVANDLNSLQKQSMYGLIDPKPAETAFSSAPAIASNALRTRTLNTDLGSFAGYKAGGTVKVRSASTWSASDMNGKSGWVMDWFYPPSNGITAGKPSEKVFTAATVRSTAAPTLVVSSNVASSGTCVADGSGYLNAFDAYHGGSLSIANGYFDINRNGITDEKFTVGGNDYGVTSIDFGIGAIGQAGFTGNNVIVQGSGAKEAGKANNLADVGTAKGAIVSRRTSWREITN
jgi:type IV pilus assembly protein PilY1